MCKALMSAPSNVHTEHITHRDDGTHRVQCTAPPCTHYGQQIGQGG